MIGSREAAETSGCESEQFDCCVDLESIAIPSRPLQPTSPRLCRLTKHPFTRGTPNAVPSALADAYASLVGSRRFHDPRWPVVYRVTDGASDLSVVRHDTFYTTYPRPVPRAWPYPLQVNQASFLSSYDSSFVLLLLTFPSCQYEIKVGVSTFDQGRKDKEIGATCIIAQNDPTLMDGFLYTCDAEILLALGHALVGNTCLRTLYLEDLVLTEEAAHTLAKGMARSNIERRSFKELSSRGRINDIFYHGIQASNTIQELELWQSPINYPGDAWRDALLGLTKITIRVSKDWGYAQAFPQVLSRATLLRHLTVVLQELEPHDMTRLAHGLCQNTSLTTLRLENFCRQDVQLLFSQELKPNSAITELDIRKCNMDDDSIELLVDQWLHNCPMEYLSFFRSDINPSKVQRLMQAVAVHPTILKLDLSFNEEIGYKGLRLIGNKLPNMQHLTHLNLHECSSCNDNLEAESEEAQAQTTAQQQAGQALLDGIKHNVSITSLSVRGNNFTLKMEDKIYFYCALNKGRHLLAAEEGPGLAPTVWCHVFVKCQRQPRFGASLMYFYLKEQPTMVQQPRHF